MGFLGDPLFVSHALACDAASAAPVSLPAVSFALCDELIVALVIYGGDPGGGSVMTVNAPFFGVSGGGAVLVMRTLVGCSELPALAACGFYSREENTILKLTSGTN